MNNRNSIQHVGNETFIEHGTPGEEGHWRTLYIKWLSDGVGVTAEDIVQTLIEALAGTDEPEAASAHTYLNYALRALQGEDLEGDVEPDPSPESEELTSDNTQLAPPLHADAFQPETSTRGVEYTQEYQPE